MLKLMLAYSHYTHIRYINSTIPSTITGPVHPSTIQQTGPPTGIKGHTTGLDCLCTLTLHVQIQSCSTVRHNIGIKLGIVQ